MDTLFCEGLKENDIVKLLSVPKSDLHRSEEYLLEISKHRKVYALPEEDTLFWNEDHLEEIIDIPYYIYDNGKKIMVNVTRNYGMKS